MGPTISSTFKEEGGRFSELKYQYNGIRLAIVWGPNKAIDREEWSICGGGLSEVLLNIENPAYYQSLTKFKLVTS